VAAHTGRLWDAMLEMSMGRVDPWVGSGKDFRKLPWIGSHNMDP